MTVQNIADIPVAVAKVAMVRGHSRSVRPAHLTHDPEPVVVHPYDWLAA